MNEIKRENIINNKNNIELCVHRNTKKCVECNFIFIFSIPFDINTHTHTHETREFSKYLEKKWSKNCWRIDKERKREWREQTKHFCLFRKIKSKIQINYWFKRQYENPDSLPVKQWMFAFSPWITWIMCRKRIYWHRMGKPKETKK